MPDTRYVEILRDRAAVTWTMALPTGQQTRLFRSFAVNVETLDKSLWVYYVLMLLMFYLVSMGY